jgi:hypothetical protein
MRLFLLILGSMISMELSAGVYKCVDATGNKIYKSIPCEAGQSKQEVNLKTGSTTDLDAIEKQQTLSLQEQEAQAEQKKLDEAELKRKQAEFEQNAKNESAKNQFLIKNNPQKYSPFAIPPYKLGDLSALVKTYETRLPEIEKLRRLAAEKALATGECGRVESVELNQKSTKDSLVILVDCSSAKKYYVTEQELTN